VTASGALIIDDRHGTCVACDRELAFFGRRVGYSYARCTACRTIQLSPFPTKAELQRAYEEDYATSGHYGTEPEAIYRAARPFYLAALDGLRSSGVTEGRVLDLGCGWGGMCRCLRDAGYEYLGADYLSESLEHCKRQGLRVTDVELEELAAREDLFSAVVMITVFEHLRDHAGTLAGIRRVLRQNGLLLILVATAGVFGWAARMARRLRRTDEIPAINTTFCPPWHTAIFSVAGLHQLLTRNGFERISVKPAPSGNGEGVLGLAQQAATLAATTGFAIFGSRWPLVLNHLFIYRSR